MMIMFAVLQELPRCDTDVKQANAVGNMAPVDLLNIELPETFN